tara:strand:- start:739 stop:1359 length:621 start_codon:yes stop_codon:yes gene_type:complete
MKIDTVTVSIDYSDYLKKIISNKELLENWLIITHKDDKKTIKVCKDNKLNYIFSKKIYKNAQFAKCKAINEGLDYIQPNNWILHIDSDVLLPENFNEILKTEVNDKDIIYGSRRYNTNGNDTSILMGLPHIDYSVGFFQLWHASEKNRYTDVGYTNVEGDVEHDESFEKRKILSLHIIDVQKHRSNLKENWVGRGPLGKSRYKNYQ